MQRVGRSMTMAITVPLLALGVGAARVAGSFEASMNRVQAATMASAQEFRQMREAAIAFGRDSGFTATAREAADVMETLAKNGLDVQQMLNGATEATLTLAAATGSDFTMAADLATDIMQQFGERASDLPRIVDRITGALIVSKFGIEDYTQAIGQAGGVSGGLGQDFDDLNTAIASTSSLFNSGSDAGTSYKTFLTRLAPESDRAREEIERLGLAFFDAAGNIRPLEEIAGELQRAFGDLNSEDLTSSMQTIFGRDAMRTAIGLMRQGADGIREVNEQINAATASSQMEARMRGLEGGLTQLKRAAEDLAIAVGDSGFLDSLASMVRGFASVISKLGELSPATLAVITTMLAFTAVAGPLVFILGSAVRVIAFLIPGLGGLATGLVAATRATGLLSTAMMVLTRIPIIALLTGLAAAFVYLSGKADETTAALDESNAALAETREELGQAELAMDDFADSGGPVEAALAGIRQGADDAAAAFVRLANSARGAFVQAAVLRRQEARGRIRTRTAQGNIFGGLYTSSQARAAIDQRNARDRAIIRNETQTIAGQGALADADVAAAASASPATTPRTVTRGGGSSPSGGGADSQVQTAKEIATAAREAADAQREKLELTLREQRANEDALADYEDQLLMQIAEIDGNEEAIRAMERERDIRERIGELVDHDVDKLEATRRALDAVNALEEARTEQRELQADASRRDLEYELARRRGDDMSGMDADRRRRSRVEELMRDQRLTEAQAQAQAMSEGAELARADLQGEWRDAFRGGLRAALNGDLGGYFENWMKERMFNSLSRVLDRLADQLANMIGSQGKSGGGIFETITGLFGIAAGGSGIKGKSPGGGPASIPGGVKVPGFATGGSFKIGGLAGMDNNLLSLNGAPMANVSRGEIMNIQRGVTNDNGGRLTIEPSPLFTVVMEQSGRKGASDVVGAQMARQSRVQRSRL